MLYAANLSNTGSNDLSLAGALHYMGIRVLERGQAAFSEGTTQYRLINMFSSPRWRWRGAAAEGAGTAFRNRHWTTAFADSRHVPWPFKPNPAAAGGQPYLRRLFGILFAPGDVRRQVNSA